MSKKLIEQEQETIVPPVQEPIPTMTHMYCGPAIPGVVSHGMLFTTMPGAMAQCIETCPAIRSFIVDPKEYVKVKQETERKGSLLYIQHQAVLEYLQRR